MWGIDDAGNRILIIDRSFLPYFYLVTDETTDPQAVLEQIKTRKAEFPFLIGLELVDRKYFGRPVKVIRAVCRDPDLMQEYCRKLSKIQGVKKCLEDDIRYSMRYLVDNDVAPCGWHEIEAEETESPPRVQIDKTYSAKGSPKAVEKTEVPNLRILAFSMVCYSPKGAPKPWRDPVAIISVATNGGDEKQFTANGSDDKLVIESFVNYVRNFDPDVIVGYGTSRQDWPYLLERSKKRSINLFVDRTDTQPHMSVYGHISVTGRANVDLLDFAEALPEVKVKTLENVADFLGIRKIENRLTIDEIDFPVYWENPAKRPELLRFSRQNTQCVMGITDAMLDFAVQLSNLVGLPLDHVGAAAVGFRVEWFLIRQAYKIGELIPERLEHPYIPYAGALVLNPKPGIHENIAVLDFKAMYPNIMRTQNVSPDTYVSPSEPDPPSGVNTAPEVNHRFRVAPPGFYKKVLSQLIAARDEIRPKLKNLDPRSTEYRVLDARQKAVKIITNASYGYAGWIGARWYIKPVAEAASAWGRQTILETIKLAEKIGLEVIYGDTDSIFVKNDAQKIEKIAKEIGEKLQLEIKPDEIYVRVLFTEAKKRYCGLLPDGQLDIVGLEVVRGDWAAVAKNVQEKTLELVLRDQSLKKAVEFIRQFISDLEKKKVPYRDLIIWKTLTKPVEKYTVNAPHVEAAKALMKEGWDFSPGDKVGFVIVSGSGRLYQKVKPHVWASIDDVDLEYYVSNQVLPAALRILSMFGITEEALRPSKPRGTLLEFTES